MEGEKAIVQNHAIAEAGVVAVPSEFNQDEMVVYLVRRESVDFDPEALREARRAFREPCS